MTKKEFYEENYLNLLNQAKEDLTFMVKKAIDKEEEETHILFHELAISQPIYREDPHDEDMSETISGAWLSGDKVGFTVDSFDSGYDIDMTDLDMDMVLYLLDEFENLN